MYVNPWYAGVLIAKLSKLSNYKNLLRDCEIFANLRCKLHWPPLIITVCDGPAQINLGK